MMQFVMAGALFLLALARIPAVRANGRDPVFQAAVFSGASSLLGNPGLYLAVDAVLGGFNLTKLAINSLMIIGLWYLRAAVVHAISPAADRRPAWVRLMPPAVTLALQTAFFFLAGPLPSTATWGEYHLLPFATLFSLMVILFVAWTSGEIAWACFRFVPRMRRSFRLGFSMLGLGSLISVLTVTLMAIELCRPFPWLPQIGPASATPPPFHLMEVFAIGLTGVGLTIPAVAGRVARRRDALRLGRTIEKVGIIREKALRNTDMERILKTDAAALPQERLHRMIVEIWDAELAARGNPALDADDRAYVLLVESDFGLERTS